MSRPLLPRRCYCLTTLALLALFASSSPTLAELPIPAGLSVGDTYQLAFATRAVTPATASDIGFYNNFVQSAADNADIGASHGVEWTAIASTATVDARANAVVGTNTPVFNLRSDGPEKVADGFADMWDGGLDAPLLYDEHGLPNTIVFGGQEFPVDAWTGTQTDGLRATGFTLGGSAGQFAWCGRISLTDDRWMQLLQPALGTPLAVYGLSEVLTVTDADFNGDERVSGADLIAWQRGKGSSGGLAAGDGNGDGTIDGADLALWESSYGSSSAAAAVVQAVPEPTAAGLAIAAALLRLTTSGRTARRRSDRPDRP